MTFLAGMPSFDLTDVAALRLRAISFFLVALLACAGGLMALWNHLQRDFERLPRLTYEKSLGIVALWGTLFLIVLTMISGARELMTPGAWKKQGATYRLSTADDDAARRERLELLHGALCDWARAHGGRLPPDDLVPEIPAAVWQSGDPRGARFAYVGSRRIGEGSAPVAFEPSGDTRLVLLADGAIVSSSIAEIRDTLAREAR